jgi:Protein of unknown function (DUF2628)
MISLLMKAKDASHVAVFTIHEPPNPPSDRIDRAEALLFVPDKFSFAAALLAPFWLASHQLWLALAAYLGATFALVAALSAIGIDGSFTLCALLALNLWLGFEASEIQRASLAAKGWSDAGSVSGRDLAECERRFFENWLGNQPVLARHDAAPPQPSNSGTASPGLLGRLFAGRA